MNKVFFPESVAVFGVSDSPSNLARVIVENLISCGYKGAIYPVGKRGGSLGDRIIYGGIEAVDAVPDLAVLLVPADTIPQTLEGCGKKGIRRVIIETAGFSEFREDRKRLEQSIREIALAWDMKVLGPNCVGIINLDNCLVLPFYPVDAEAVKRGGISFVSQSGGLLHDIMNRASLDNFGLSKLASIGNKLLVDENDVLEFLISDPATKTIGLYLENIRDGRRLMDLAYSTDKPVIMLKANRSQTSRQIAKFHTSALAGDDEVADAGFRQCGIHRPQDLVEMMDWFRIFTLPLMRGPRVFLLARSGGKAVLLADTAQRCGFELATPSEAFYDKVRQKVRAGVINLTNPLDLGDLFDVDFYIEIIREASAEEGVDGVVMVHDYAPGVEVAGTQRLVTEAVRISNIHQKPVVLCMVPDKNDWFPMRALADLPLFMDGDTAMKALAISRDHFRFCSRKTERPRLQGQDRGVRRPPSSPAVHMDIVQTFRLLASYGLPVADHQLIRSEAEALEAAGRIGYPVALKIALPYTLHKTEEKGVRLNLGDEKALLAGFRDMKGEAFLVQKMAPSGYEVFVGGKRDLEFGQTLLVGLGGIFVEVYKDVALRVAPIDEALALDMITETRGSAILKGFRGSPPGDIDELCRCLVRVSRLLADNPQIVTLDINPLILFHKDEGCLIVDARIEEDGVGRV